MGKFKAEVDKWITESEARMLRVTRFAVQDVVNEAQTSIRKEGKMPVVTGFLRASGASNIGSMPLGPDKRFKDEPGSYPSPDSYITDSKVSVNLANLKFGDVFYFGWTAEYARVIEMREAFLV